MGLGANIRQKIESKITPENATELELSLLKKRLEKSNKKDNPAYSAKNVMSFNEFQKREGELQKTGIWKATPDKVIEKVTQLERKKKLSGFYIKNPETDIVQGLSPFVVTILPQTHKVTSKKANGEVQYQYFDDALESQENIYKTLKTLRNNDVTAVNAWEGIQNNEHPHSMIDIAAMKAEAVHDSHVLLRKYQLNNPDISHQSLNYRIESARDQKLMEKRREIKKLKGKYSKIRGYFSQYQGESVSWNEIEKKFREEEIQVPSSLKERFPTTGNTHSTKEVESFMADQLKAKQKEFEAVYWEIANKRNAPIVANLLMLQENTGANAINLIVGEDHFTSPNMKDPIQDILREWGISYIYLTPKED